LGRDAFMEFIRSKPAAAIHMLMVLGQRQRETNEKLRGIKNANEVIAQKRTSAQKAAEKIADTFASNWYVLMNLIFFAGWIVLNTWRMARGLHPFDDPPTFFTLGFIITLEAILLSMFVLNSQKRQADRDRIRSDLEYQINLKAHLEVMALHQKVDRLAGMVELSLPDGADAPRHAAMVL